MPITPLEYLGLALLGLAAGTMGGLLGVGGSLLVIPALVLFFPFDGRPIDMQLAIAAAMWMNAGVGAMSAWRYWRAGLMQADIIRWLIPATLAGATAGVLWGNTFVEPAAQRLLQQAFGAFALYTACHEVLRFWRSRSHAGEPETAESEPDATRASPTAIVAVGMVTGLVAGLLGIGGGGFALPLQQMFLGVRLRNAIANSALTVFAGSLLGAALKLATAGHLLPEAHGWLAPLWIDLGLFPAAVAGAFLGATLTQALPVRWLRVPFFVLMIVMGLRLILG